jgi:diguanylate cyclase (GGDEF)-like protein
MGVATKIHQALTQPYILPLDVDDLELEHHCTASIGVILFLDHEGSADELIKWADNAMYQAKAKGRNQIVLDLV